MGHIDTEQIGIQPIVPRWQTRNLDGAIRSGYAGKPHAGSVVGHLYTEATQRSSSVFDRHYEIGAHFNAMIKATSK